MEEPGPRRLEARRFASRLQAQPKGLAGPPRPMAPRDREDASFEDFDVVPGAKGLDGVLVPVGKAVHLKKVVGESAWDDGQEQFARRRADVTEGVRDVAGADGHRPRGRLDRP